MDATTPRPPELAAPAHWRTVDFISDLHLQPAEPGTVAAWRRYMQATPADALFILGDLFEVWIGDDAAQPGSFEADCAGALRALGQRMPVYFLCGNRDFLLGPGFLAQSGMQGLEDPSVLAFLGQRYLLSHGDALCLDDTEYLRFRAQVRQPGWQQAFLSRPLEERRAIARQLRDGSEAHKRQGLPYADVDTPAALRWLADADAQVLIHGHTHHPGEHLLAPDGRRRIVLSDWDADAHPPRLEVLRLGAEGLRRLPLDG